MLRHTDKELEEKLNKEVDNLDELILEKIDKYGGALTREGALILIAKEKESI